MSDCPSYWHSFPSYSLRCKAGAAIAAQTKQRKQFQKEQKYDDKHKTNSASRFQRTGRHEINASCDWQRFFAQSIKAAKRSPIPGGDRGESLRDLARARTGTGPSPGALVRSRTAVAARVSGPSIGQRKGAEGGSQPPPFASPAGWSIRQMPGVRERVFIILLPVPPKSDEGG